MREGGDWTRWRIDPELCHYRTNHGIAGEGPIMELSLAYVSEVIRRHHPNLEAAIEHLVEYMMAGGYWRLDCGDVIRLSKLVYAVQGSPEHGRRSSWREHWGSRTDRGPKPRE